MGVAAVFVRRRCVSVNFTACTARAPPLFPPGRSGDALGGCSTGATATPTPPTISLPPAAPRRVGYTRQRHSAPHPALNLSRAAHALSAGWLRWLWWWCLQAKRKPKIAKGARDFMPDQMAIRCVCEVCLCFWGGGGGAQGDEGRLKSRGRSSLATRDAYPPIACLPGRCWAASTAAAAHREVAFGTITSVFKRHGAVSIDTPVFELRCEGGAARAAWGWGRWLVLVGWRPKHHAAASLLLYPLPLPPTAATAGRR